MKIVIFYYYDESQILCLYPFFSKKADPNIVFNSNFWVFWKPFYPNNKKIILPLRNFNFFQSEQP